MSRVFKYRTFNDYTEDTLYKGSLCYSSATEFNDPFDSVIRYANKDVYRKLKSDIKFLADFYIFSYFSENNTNPNNDQIETFINDVRSSNKLKQMIEENINRAVNYVRDLYHIFCLSRNNNNPLMWGYYTDSGKGYVIEYDYDDLIKNANEYNKSIGFNGQSYIDPVSYSHEGNQTQLIIDVIKTVYEYAANAHETVRYEFYGTPMFKDIFYTKYPEWHHEDEERIIIPNPNINNKNTLIFNNKIKAIFMGYAISDEHKKYLIDFCKKKKGDIKLYQMKIEYGIDELNIHPEIIKYEEE